MGKALITDKGIGKAFFRVKRIGKKWILSEALIRDKGIGKSLIREKRIGKSINQG